MRILGGKFHLNQFIYLIDFVAFFPNWHDKSLQLNFQFLKQNNAKQCTKSWTNERRRLNPSKKLKNTWKAELIVLKPKFLVTSRSDARKGSMELFDFSPTKQAKTLDSGKWIDSQLVSRCWTSSFFANTAEKNYLTKFRESEILVCHQLNHFLEKNQLENFSYENFWISENFVRKCKNIANQKILG